MCGICGIFHLDSQEAVDPDLLQRMTDILRHRGPDDEGGLIDGSLGLGVRRLAIVGLGSGHMPMSTEDENVWVVYNGELYNHPEIKKELTGKGYGYRTGSDTESYLHLYSEYGERFLEKTRGMFALALWDRRRRRLILARDRLGIKPLYYHFDGRTLRFGSEIKAILCDPEVTREIDYEALNLYLAYLATPPPYTLFRGIKQVLPGEMLVIEDGNLRFQPFWNPEESMIESRSGSIAEWKAELAGRLRTAVREHLLSDVPVGAFLSGGIDSGILVGLMRECLGPGFKTFSIGFKDHKLFDETPAARLIAKKFGTDHYERILEPTDLLNALEDITWQLDEPLADSSTLPVYFVSKLAAEHGKVALSGDGGDEVFAGYRKYQAEYFRRFFAWLPAPALRFLSHHAVAWLPESRSNYWMDLARQVKKFFRGLNPDPFERHAAWATYFECELRRSLLLPDIRKQIEFDLPMNYRRKLYEELDRPDIVNRMLWVDLRHGLPADMLMKVDRMSMLHSLEVRVPYLDHTLVEFAFSLPGSVKLKGKTTKWILKETFKDLLPPEIMNRPKHGFDVPVGEWFRNELSDLVEEVGSESTTNRRGLFDPRQVRRIIKDHQDGKRDYNNQLWILLSLELWQRQYLDPGPGSIPSRPGGAEWL